MSATLGGRTGTARAGQHICVKIASLRGPPRSRDFDSNNYTYSCEPQSFLRQASGPKVRQTTLAPGPGSVYIARNAHRFAYVRLESFSLAPGGLYQPALPPYGARNRGGWVGDN